MILLDTCALLWWTLEPENLSAKASEIVANIQEQGAFISSISFWEIGIKVRKGSLYLPISLLEFANRIRKLGFLEIIPIDEKIWIENINLDWSHRDPADRTIVATAMLHDLSILTKDRLILDFYDKAVW